MKRLFKSAAAVATKDDIGSRLLFGFAAVVIGSLLMTASARTQIPFWPVPMTMQTMAAILIGMTLGSRLGFIVVTAYVLEGLMGLPVFANSPTARASSNSATIPLIGSDAPKTQPSR